MKDDNYYMQTALNLAKKGEYFVKANPMVGCVIVRNDKIIATGYHQKFGENHAEINALEKINFNATNCDIFITLEPCSHQGKTPPCVDSIIKSNPSRVIISTLDNNPQVSSIKQMRAAKIEVITGVLAQEGRELNRGFFKRMKTGMPFLTCKIASSLDGRTAMENGESQWITGKSVKADVFKLRAGNQAIITGSGTILQDNPQMNTRIDNMPSPLKVVMDRSNKITDKNLHIFTGEKCIVTDKKPKDILKMLGNLGINYCLLESGSLLNASFLNLIDELIEYKAPIIMGSSAKPMFTTKINSMDKKIQLKVKSISQISNDIKIVYELNR